MTMTAEVEIKTGDVRIRVIVDSDPEHPRRDWDCQLDTMLCWHRRYDLGDENPHKDGRPAHMFLEILSEAGPEVLRRVLITIVKSDNHVHGDYLSNIEGMTLQERRDYWHYFLCCQMEHSTTEEWNQALLYAVRKVAMIMPLHLYDHSGITMSTTGFSCPWDSGQVGWIYMTFKKFIEETGHASDEEKTSGKLGKESLKKLEAWLISSVKTYDQFLRGDIYGFVMETAVVCGQGHAHWDHEDSCWGFYGTDFDNGMSDHISEEHHELLKAALGNPEYS